MFSGPVGPTSEGSTDFLLANQGIIVPQTDGLPSNPAIFGFPFGQARTYTTLTVKVVNPIASGDAVAVVVMKNGVQVGPAALFVGPTLAGTKQRVIIPTTTWSAPAGVPDEMNVQASVEFADSSTINYVLVTVQ
jgi:hypothetical protein